MLCWSPTQCWVIQQTSFINTFPWILESLLMKFPLLEVKLNESYCYPWNGKYLDPQKFRIQFLTFWKWKVLRQLFCASLEILRSSEACFMKGISVSHKIRFPRYTTKSLVTSNIVCNHFLTPCHRVSFFLLFLLLLNNSSSSTAGVLKLLPPSWWSSSESKGHFKWVCGPWWSQYVWWFKGTFNWNLEFWILIIQKSTVILPSSMVFFINKSTVRVI